MIQPGKPLTPIEQLLAEKTDVQNKCRMREKNLNENFDYIRDNTAGFILSGLSSLLFPSRGAKTKPHEQAVAVIENKQSPENALVSFDNMMIVAKSLVPLAWTVIQPLLVRWAIKKAKSMLLGLFSKKNRKSNVK